MKLARVIHRRVAQIAGELRAAFQAERRRADYRQGDTVRAPVAVISREWWGQFDVLLMDVGNGVIRYRPGLRRYRVWRELP